MALLDRRNSTWHRLAVDWAFPHCDVNA